MKKSIMLIVAAAAVVFGAFSCSKPYDDSELRNKITGLETRISALESIQSQINELKTTVEKLQGGLKVTNVEKNGDTVTIKFSDGTSVNLSTTVIGVAEIDGVFCWTLNGQAMKDPSGHVIPVGTQAPQLRAAADGTLEYSIDGGKTWNPLAGKMETPTVEETDDAYIIHFGESSFTLPKDSPFFIRFAVASNFSIAYGETGEVKYEINGASISEDVEVGILAHDEGFEVELVPADAQGGLLKITNNNKTAESGRVIMYAANHKGKSDIKTLIFHSEPSGEVEFTAVLDAAVEEIPAAGGVFYINVKADEDYSVGPDCDWLAVTPPTRALYEDRLAVTVFENTTTEPRVGHVLLFSLVSDIMFSVEVKQAAGEEPQAATGYESFLGLWHGNAGYFYAQEYVDEETGEATEGIYNFVYDGFFEGANYGMACGYHHFDDDDLDVMYFVTYVFAEEDNWTYFFAALDSDDYIETGGSEGDEVLAWGMLDENGDLNIIGNEYDAVYSGTTYHEVIVALQCFGYLSEDEGSYKKGYYSFNNCTQLDLPAVFSPEEMEASAVAVAKKAVESHIGIKPVKVRQPLNLQKSKLLK